MTIGDSLFALVVIAAPLGLLGWNEMSTAARRSGFAEARRNVVSVAADRVEPENEGKLVHLVAEAKGRIMMDPVFGVSAEGLKLIRTVEMYQWKESRRETKRNDRSYTEYSYAKSWNEQPIDSSKFRDYRGHENPAAMPATSATFDAVGSTAGPFTLTGPALAAMDWPSPLDPGQARGERSPRMFKKPLHRHGQGYYLGADPANPAVGDLRISFSILAPGEATWIARQERQTLREYQPSGGNRILLAAPGRHTAAELLDEVEAADDWRAWLWRGGTCLVLFIGLVAAAVLRDETIAAGTLLFALLTALASTSLVVAWAWLEVSPIVGRSAMALAAVAFALLFALRARRHPKTGVA